MAKSVLQIFDEARLRGDIGAHQDEVIKSLIKHVNYGVGVLSPVGIAHFSKPDDFIVLSSTANTWIHAIFIDRVDSDVAAYFKLYDGSTATPAVGDVRVIFPAPLSTDSDPVLWTSLKGIKMGTGVVISNHTGIVGTTVSDEADRVEGFILYSISNR